MDVKKLVRQIYWCVESMHSARQIEQFLNSKGIGGTFAEQQSLNQIPGQSMLRSLIFSVFKSYAECRVAYLQLTEKSRDVVLRPVIEPHLLVNLCYSRDPLTRPGVRGAQEGQRLGFTIWDGDGAPEELQKWTGVVQYKEPMFGGGPMEYIMKRDADGQLIKLQRSYLTPCYN